MLIELIEQSIRLLICSKIFSTQTLQFYTNQILLQVKKMLVIFSTDCKFQTIIQK